MPLHNLSRWTMAWFAAAMLFLLSALTLALTGAVGPGDWSRGAGLGVVHLFTLGWLCLAMLGALIQFVPVLTARTPDLPGLSLPALLAAIGGVFCLTAGFLWLDGHEEARPLFLAAPLALVLALGLVVAMIAPALLSATSRNLTEVRMVLLALVGLLALWISGSGMMMDLAGLSVAPGLLPDAVPLHVMLGLGGWLSLAAFGVSYKLFAMFLLSPEQGGRLRHGVFLTAALALLIVLAGAMALVSGHDLPLLLPGLLSLLLPATIGAYLAEVARLWRLRRRAKPEGNMQWSRAALAFFALSGVLSLPALWWGGVWGEAAIFVALTGWLSLLTLAQMIKITSFLTWIQIFAPRIGRGPVPLVHQLSDEKATANWLALWSSGVSGGTVSLLLSLHAGFRLSLVALLLAAIGIARELVAIRRLEHLDPSRRPALLPPVILPHPSAEFHP